MGAKLIFGVGVKDVDYKTHSNINGKIVICPYFSVWTGMLRRCYSVKWQGRNPSYIGCSVSEEWRLFSNFKKWMQSQNWKNKHLDKDLLVKGNKQYSSESCVFIDGRINLFLTDRYSLRGKYLIGVDWCKKQNKYRAKCRDGSGKQVFLGYFCDELSAHMAWKRFKHSLACDLAEEQTDQRVAVALRQRYL